MKTNTKVTIELELEEIASLHKALKITKEIREKMLYKKPGVFYEDREDIPTLYKEHKQLLIDLSYMLDDIFDIIYGDI